MLGFVPHCSSSDYKCHGDKILAASSDPRVRLVCDWWQSHNCWYAFESHEGALWWGKHGGPPQFSKQVSTLIPPRETYVRPAQPRSKASCFMCDQPLFDSCTDVLRFVVMSCTCSNWYMHTKCRKVFNIPRCCKCNGIYSDTVCSHSLVSFLGKPKLSLQ